MQKSPGAPPGLFCMACMFLPLHWLVSTLRASCEGAGRRDSTRTDPAELLRFGVAPSAEWTVGSKSGYPLTGTFIGMETITVPAGTFPDCLKFEVCKRYDETTRETWTLWLARNTGMIREEKVLVNHGETRERMRNVLRTVER